jgi:multidrug efflux pump subunit AcrA (membrane-fusion protein)
MGGLATMVCLGALAMPSFAAETCTTQSQMQAADRTALAAAAQAMAAQVQADDAEGLKSATIAEFQRNFGGIAAAVASTSAQVKGATAQVEGLYLLDASTLQAANGVNPDAQFFCSLRASPGRAAGEVEFSIPQLPPGKYAFATVRMESSAPWQLSFLLRQDGGTWLLAGFYPKPVTADGHDGLWYWTAARKYVAEQHPWAGWLYYQEAQALLAPANFVSSTHLDKLQAELQTAVPPAIANGLSVDAPLVLKVADGTEYRLTSLGVDPSLGLDVAAHLKVDSVDDTVAARTRNVGAMVALIAAHPELKQAFHGIWVFADAPGKAPYATELAMADVK